MKKKEFDYFDMPKELEFMLALAVEKAEHVPSNLDWDYFSKLVKKNRIEPLLADRIKKLPADEWQGIDVLEEIVGKSSEYAFISMRQISALASIFRLFEDNGIRALSVKGPLLAMELYGNPALRYSKDLDVWVEPEKILKAMKVLKKNGWVEERDYKLTNKRYDLLRKHGQHFNLVKDNVILELHWRVKPWNEADFERLWDGHREKLLAGVKVNTLSSLDDNFFQINHATRHGFHRLRWLIDIKYLFEKTALTNDELVEKFDVENKELILVVSVLSLAKFNLLDGDFESEKLSVFINQKKDKLYLIINSDISLSSLGQLTNCIEKISVNFYENIYENLDYRLFCKLLSHSKKEFMISSLNDLFIPTHNEYKLVDLPDKKFWLYYIIRPVNTARRAIIEIIKKI